MTAINWKRCRLLYWLAHRFSSCTSGFFPSIHEFHVLFLVPRVPTTNLNVYFFPKSFKLWVWNCKCRHCGERETHEHRNTLGVFLCTVKKRSHFQYKKCLSRELPSKIEFV
ncbi:hypothetical protein VNO80_09628 [Phaseolus coccineus]|uniref:Uncharacterized protein n=1 Tax=Phaseolus coccineus TaxID=3886 RepID=A0AAN9NCX6_PHACN